MHGFLTEVLDAKHHRNHFSCGNRILDNYLQKQARQDVKRKLAACFVLCEASNDVIGFYTLSNAGIPRSLVPEAISQKMPMAYTDLPVTLLGRLAVNQQHKGQNLGKLLLIDALKRSFEVSKLVGSMAVVVDPIDQQAVDFYAKYGFTLLPDSGKMFIPMKTVELLFTV